jgi:hypothetical protein
MRRLFVVGALLIAVVVTAYFAVPPWVELRRVDQAVTDLEALSDGAKRYFEQTGVVVPDLDALLSDPGVARWNGPYLPYESVPSTPWGGEYGLDVDRGLVGLPAENARVPEKYRFGGIAELSLPIRENPKWWASDRVSR